MSAYLAIRSFSKFHLTLPPNISVLFPFFATSFPIDHYCNYNLNADTSNFTSETVVIVWKWWSKPKTLIKNTLVAMITCPRILTDRFSANDHGTMEKLTRRPDLLGKKIRFFTDGNVCPHLVFLDLAFMTDLDLTLKFGMFWYHPIPSEHPFGSLNLALVLSIISTVDRFCLFVGSEDASTVARLSLICEIF